MNRAGTGRRLAGGAARLALLVALAGVTLGANGASAQTPPDFNFGQGDPNVGTCQTDGTWRIDYFLTIDWHGPPPVSPATQITDFVLGGVASGDQTGAWSPNPLPATNPTRSDATIILPGSLIGTVTATITFDSEPSPTTLGPISTSLGNTPCVAAATTSTTAASTTTTTRASSSTTTTQAVAATTTSTTSLVSSVHGVVDELPRTGGRSDLPLAAATGIIGLGLLTLGLARQRASR